MSFVAHTTHHFTAGMTKEIAMEYYCLNCGWCNGVIKEAQDLHMRLGPGDLYPSGECGDCGALCFDSKLVLSQPDCGAIFKQARKERFKKMFTASNATTIYLQDDNEIVVNCITDKVTDCECGSCKECEEQAYEGAYAWIPQSTSNYVRTLLTKAPELLDQLDILHNAVSKMDAKISPNLQCILDKSEKLIMDIMSEDKE